MKRYGLEPRRGTEHSIINQNKVKNVLTDRQKQLDRAIEDCGVKLDGSDRCLKKVMEAIEKDDARWEFLGKKLGIDL